MNTLIVTMALIVAILLIVVISVGLYLIFTEQKKRTVLQETIVYADIYSKSDMIKQCLEDFITERLDNYKICNPKIFDEYIDEKAQIKILKDVNKDVLEAISPLLLKQICFMYNKNYVSRLITNTIRLNVMALALEVNHDIISKE